MEVIILNWINDIKKYIPYNEQEGKDKELILSAISNLYLTLIFGG